MLDNDYVDILKKISDLEEEINIINNTPFVHEYQKLVSDNDYVFELTPIFNELYVSRRTTENSIKRDGKPMSMFPKGFDTYDTERLIKKLMLESRKQMVENLREKIKEYEAAVESLENEGV